MNDLSKTGFMIPGENEDQYLVNDRKNAQVFTVPFTPLEQRIHDEQPELFDGLQKLKQSIGTEAFEKYFSTIQSLKMNSAKTTILMTTSHAMQKTSIEANYLAHIEQAFDVEYVRIVSI